MIIIIRMLKCHTETITAIWGNSCVQNVRDAGASTKKNTEGLPQRVFAICGVGFTLLHIGKVEKVWRTMYPMIELFRFQRLQFILHIRIVPHTLRAEKIALKITSTRKDQISLNWKSLTDCNYWSYGSKQSHRIEWNQVSTYPWSCSSMILVQVP